MPKIVFLRQPKKFITKASDDLYLKLKKEIDLIAKDSKRTEKLGGKLKGIYSHHFFYKRSEYRIAYRFDGGVLVILISTRENFYETLSRKV